MYSLVVDTTLRVAFTVLICADFAGNILVCLVVRRFPFMKTTMNYLLVHLAVCDMLVGLFLFPRHVIFGLYEHPDGLTGDLLCKFITFGIVAWLFTGAGIFTLVVVAWERYNAIVKPFESLMAKSYLKFAILLCWVLGVVITLPETIAMVYNPSIKSCDYVWNEEWARTFDGVLWVLVVWCLPFTVMLILYGAVIRRLWFCDGPDDLSQRSLQLSRKRITQTGVTVTIIFFLCFSPNALYYFIASISPKNASPIDSFQTAVPVFYPLSHLLIVFNSSINPVIYALQSTRFRRCMSAVLFGGIQNRNRINDSVGLRRINTRDKN